jgi:deoxyribodipyrimidine photolyase-related protein
MASKSIFLVFPNQLFDQPSQFWSKYDEVHLIEHDIGFGGDRAPVSRFHIKRLMYLRASMLNYQTELEKQKTKTKYIYHKDWKTHFSQLQKSRINIATYRPSDYKLEEDITQLAKKGELGLGWHPNPNWILNEEECIQMLGKPPFKNYTFYAMMRKKYNILMTKSGEPFGGVVRFDVENREKIPTSELDNIPPSPSYLIPPEVAKSVLADFPDSLAITNLDDPNGSTDRHLQDKRNKITVLFPISRAESKKALAAFIKKKLDKFGPYEDALVSSDIEGGATNYHSALSAAINVGWLQPMDVINSAVRNLKGIPIPSVEGFVAQVLGWREYMRALYVVALHNRTTMLAIPSDGRTNKLGDSWYKANTGIQPLDDTLKRTLENGYNHHIERLMVIGSVMYMCDIAPSEVYHWFNEMYIDSWDWVMYGNVFIMSQYCFPKLATTKPYFSSSNYIIKMSNYKPTKLQISSANQSNENVPWQIVWDALYWNKIDAIREILKKNYRMAAQVSFYDKKSSTDKKEIEKISKNFISKVVAH